MNNMNNLDIILQYIDNPPKKTRKLTMNDLFNEVEEFDISPTKFTKKDKIRKYRMQGEYGTKKFIKP